MKNFLKTVFNSKPFFIIGVILEILIVIFLIWWLVLYPLTPISKYEIETEVRFHVTSSVSSWDMKDKTYHYTITGFEDDENIQREIKNDRIGMILEDYMNNQDYRNSNDIYYLKLNKIVTVSKITQKDISVRYEFTNEGNPIEIREHEYPSKGGLKIEESKN